jgi:hypothetical protein
VTADGVDHGRLVEVGVRVDAADHRHLICHAVRYCPSDARLREDTRRSGVRTRSGQDCDGTFGQAPIRSQAPDRTRAEQHRPDGRRFQLRTAEASVSGRVRPPERCRLHPHSQWASQDRATCASPSADCNWCADAPRAGSHQDVRPRPRGSAGRRCTPACSP